jgi:uncharacterized protein YukE
MEEFDKKMSELNEGLHELKSVIRQVNEAAEVIKKVADSQGTCKLSDEDKEQLKTIIGGLENAGSAQNAENDSDGSQQ